MPRVWGATVLCAAVALTAATPAHADDLERARALAAEGTALARADKFEAAIAKYKEAETHAASPGNDCNIGVAYLKLGRWHQAELFISRCKRRWADQRERPLPDWVPTADARIRSELASGGYAPVSISTLPGDAQVTTSALAADEWVKAPVTIFFAPGKHTVTVRRDGREAATRPIEVRSSEAVSLSITLPEPPAIERDPPPDDKRGADEGEGSTGEPPGRERPELGGEMPGTVTRGAPPTSSSRPWIVGGASLGVAAAAGVVHILAAGKRADAEELEAGPEFDTQLASFRRYRTSAVALYAASAVGLGVAYVLLRLDRSANHRPQIDAAVGDGGGSIGISWTFE